MEKSKKQIFLGCLFLIGLSIFLYQTFYVAPEILSPHYKTVEELQNKNISAEEVRAFLKTALIYKEENPEIPFNGNLSYSTETNLTSLNPYMSKWLKERGWNADRFFYIGARLKIIMDTIRRDKEILKLQKLMLDGVSVSQSADMQKTLKELAKEQEKSLNVEQISSQEREMVEPEQEVIQKLFPQLFN